MEERDEGHVAEEVDVVTYAVAASSGGLVQRAETGSSEHQDDNGGSVLRLCVVRESAAAQEGRALPTKSTGTTVWPAALVLCKYIVAHKDQLAGKTLLELGAGTGLSGLLAARYCDRVWLTDKDPQVLDVLRRSVQLNTDVRDKIHVEKLVWGAQESYALPPRFDLIIASDTLYYLTAVEQLWKSVDSLLSRERCADGSSPLFIMAHVNREKAIDSELHKTAQRLGFVAQAVPLSALYRPHGASAEAVPSNEHVKKEMLRLFVFVRAQHVGGGGIRNTPS